MKVRFKETSKKTAPGSRGIFLEEGGIAEVSHDDGQHRFIGKHLRALLRQAGFSRVEASARYAYNLGDPEHTRRAADFMASRWLGPIGQRIIDLG